MLSCHQSAVLSFLISATHRRKKHNLIVVSTFPFLPNWMHNLVVSESALYVAKLLVWGLPIFQECAGIFCCSHLPCHLLPAPSSLPTSSLPLCHKQDAPATYLVSLLISREKKWGSSPELHLKPQTKPPSPFSEYVQQVEMRNLAVRAPVRAF